MEINIRTLDICDIVQVSGRIDSFTSPSLLEKLNELVTINRYKIILDLESVSFVSSAGLRVFIDIQKTCKKQNQGEVILACVSQRVHETLELAGFAPLFKFCPDVNSAIEAFKQ